MALLGLPEIVSKNFNEYQFQSCVCVCVHYPKIMVRTPADLHKILLHIGFYANQVLTRGLLKYCRSITATVNCW